MNKKIDIEREMAYIAKLYCVLQNKLEIIKKENLNDMQKEVITYIECGEKKLSANNMYGQYYCFKRMEK